MEETEKTADVILGEDDAEGATVGVNSDTENTESEVKTSENTDSETKTEAKSDKDDKAEEEVDFESVLLAPDDKSETAKTEDAEEVAAESTLSESLKTLKAMADSLDSLPESQDANFNRLRKMNRELIKGEITKLEDYERLTSYGSKDRVEEALELLDGLDGYDADLGQPSTRGFAEKYAAKDPEKAYNLALNLMLGKTPDGREFADVFTRKVLGLDPARLVDFQAISKGEVPEGYEGMIAVTKDLERVEPQYHEAFKRLTPKAREIVAEGLDQYATQSEKAEAMRMLQDSQKVIQDAIKEKQEGDSKLETYQNDLITKATEIETAATESIGTKISNGLSKVVFSSDKVVDLTMKQAVETRLFDLVHESPYVRGRAEAYLKEVGVEVDRPKLDYHYKRLSENIDIETVATLKGHKSEAAKARAEINDAESRIAAMGLKIIAQVARKAGGKLAVAAAEKAGLPKNQLPPTDKTDTTASNGSKSFTWQEAAAAQRAGKVIGVGS